jgi:hypothetical protein
VQEGEEGRRDETDDLRRSGRRLVNDDADTRDIVWQPLAGRCVPGLLLWPRLSAAALGASRMCRCEWGLAAKAMTKAKAADVV